MPSGGIRQVAAPPHRTYPTGSSTEPFVLLITSRQPGRSVMPKSNLMVGKAGHEAAARVDEIKLGALINHFGEGRGPRPAA